MVRDNRKSRRRHNVAQRMGLRFVRTAKKLRRRSKQMVMLAADSFGMPAALFLAIALRTGSLESGLHVSPWLYVTVVLASVPLFVRVGLYRAVVRFLGAQAAVVIIGGVLFSAAAVATLSAVTFGNQVPPEAFVIYFALAVLYVGATRFGARELLRLRTNSTEPVVIYGAGSAGAQLSYVLAANSRFRPVALIDDNITAQGVRVHGLRVLPPSMLPELRRRHGVDLVLLAMPSATRRRRSQIIETLTAQDLRVQTVPDIGEIVSGRARLEEIRDIDVHDLLGRDPVPPNAALLGACIRAKSILVTGAGGSIGSSSAARSWDSRRAAWCCWRCPNSRCMRSSASCGRSTCATAIASS